MGTAPLNLLAAAGTIYSGLQQKKALEAQAGFAEYEGQIAALRGKQISAEKRDELNRVLAAIDTMRVNRGTGLDSPTGVALRKGQRERASFARNAATLSEQFRQVKANADKQGYLSAASLAPVTGFIQAVPFLTSAASDFASAAGGGA